MDIDEYISADEAAKILDYRKESITLLCRQGKFEGVKRIGHQWFIPRNSVKNYVKAPQGFAAIWKRRREAEKIEAENYILDDEDSETPESEVPTGKKNIELEILRSLKVLIKEVRKIERAIAQAKP